VRLSFGLSLWTRQKTIPKSEITHCLAVPCFGKNSQRWIFQKAQNNKITSKVNKKVIVALAELMTLAHTS